MDPTVQLTFCYAEKDYVQAVRAHHASRLRWRLIIFLLIVVIGAGIYILRSNRNDWFGVVILSSAVLLALLFAALYFIMPRLNFRREPKFRDEYSMTFSPDGIRFRTAHIDSQLQWSIYSRVLIIPDSYLLYYGMYNFTLVPKQAFQSAEQEQAFATLLAQHVPEIVSCEL
jgi:4-amino-4-deoxy-L-arabinose transferase-like glycosyltransferase